MTFSFRIGKLKFRSRKAALTHFLAYDRLLKKEPLRKGPVFEELKSLFLTYSECCEKWGQDGRNISAFSLEEGDGQNSEDRVPDRCYLAHFLWTPAQAFSVREAVNAIAGTTAAWQQ